MSEDLETIKQLHSIQRVYLKKLNDLREEKMSLMVLLGDLEELTALLFSNEIQNMIYEVIETRERLKGECSQKQIMSLFQLKTSTSNQEMLNQYARNKIDSLLLQIKIEQIKLQNRLKIVNLDAEVSLKIQSQKMKICDDSQKLETIAASQDQYTQRLESNIRKEKMYDSEISVLFNQIDQLQGLIRLKEDQLIKLCNAKSREFSIELKKIQYKNTFFKTIIQEFLNLIFKQNIETKSQYTNIGEEVAKLDREQLTVWRTLQQKQNEWFI